MQQPIQTRTIPVAEATFDLLFGRPPLKRENGSQGKDSSFNVSPHQDLNRAEAFIITMNKETNRSNYLEFVFCKDIVYSGLTSHFNFGEVLKNWSPLFHDVFA